LLDKNLLVLTGHPGEGKTAMAANLALEGGAKRENCVKLECASDWKDVDWSLRCFTTVIIDDIFGGRSLDHELLKDWKSVLNDIELFTKDKELKVIITSRHYITKDAREVLDNITMFTETSGYTTHLQSTDLSIDEMKCILKAVLRRSGTEENMKKFEIELDECVAKTIGLYNGISGRTSDTVFGFPECAVLFATGSLMERHGSEFFGSPESHFKTYVEQLYKPRHAEQFYKFLTLVIIWSEKTQTIKQEDIRNPLNVSAHVQHIADCFGVKIDHFFIETLKSSLLAYSKFLLLDINKTGHYTFTHNVIGEMVGVVLGEHRPLECIQLCQSDFLMERITLSKSDQVSQSLKVVIEPDLENALIQKFVQKICRDGCTFSEEQSNSSLLDAAIFKHEAFECNTFANAFVLHITNNKLAEKLFQVSVRTADNRHIYLLEFILENNLFTLAEQIVPHIEQLLRNRTYVSVRAICIVMLNCPSLFEMLFGFNRAGVNDVFYLKNLHSHGKGTTLLIEAARNNLDYAVSLLLRHGAEVHVKTNSTPLYVAARHGHHAIVEILLQHGAEINARTYKSETPLYEDAWHSHDKVMDILLQYEAEIGSRADQNWTPLHVAARFGHYKVVEILLQHGAEINARTDDNLTPLYEAACGGHHMVVAILLKHGADINARTFKIDTPLHEAAWNGHDTVVEILLQHGAEINSRAYNNWTPLHKAARHGHHTVVEVLLQHGAEINAKSDMKKTPLHVAAWYGHYTVVKILLQHGAEINSRAYNNWTPLHKAARHGHHTVVEILLQHGAEINAKSDMKKTPLHVAALNGHHNVVKILLQHGAEINARIDGNWTPLHVAAQNGHHTVVTILLQHGAEINARTDTNVTPLFIAAENGHHMAVTILLQHGAEINARIDGNWTPLHVAAQNGHHTVVTILLQHGAEINARTDTNETPLMIAKRKRHDMVEKVLQEHRNVGV